MKRRRARGRGTWAELIFFCLMLVGIYFIFALLNFAWIGSRGRAAGVYLRERWGGAFIVILLFWVYLCLARLLRVRVPRISAQILGTLVLYFAVNFIFGLVRCAGWNTGFALLSPSYTGMSAANFFILNFGAPGAIIAAILFLLVAAVLFRAKIALSLISLIMPLIQRLQAQSAERERAERLERIEAAERRKKERQEREIIERERAEREWAERERIEIEQRERREIEAQERAREEIERERLKRAERFNAPFSINNNDNDLAFRAADKANIGNVNITENIKKENKNIKFEDVNLKTESPKNVNISINDKEKAAADILGDILNSLESGAFAVPDKLLRPLDGDTAPEAPKYTVSIDKNKIDKNKYGYENINNDNYGNDNDYDAEDLEGKIDTEYEDNTSGELIKQGEIIIETLKNFGVNASIAHIITGPSVIQFQLALSRGVKVDRLPRFANDLAMALAVVSVRIEAPIPGKHFAGIEIPNPERRVILLESALEAPEFKNSGLELAIPIGMNIDSKFIISGLENMTHLVAAGAAGSGKSVFINNCIVSMCVNNSPENLKLILIDPRRVEFAIYDGLPHLIAAPASDAQKAVEALSWAINEMERRMELFAEAKVRNLAAYNNKYNDKKLARIVIAIDEPGDLTYASGRDNRDINNNIDKRGVGDLTALLVRSAGAAGIHLIITTQRPSMNLINEIVKTNIPARAAFALPSQTESRLFTGFSGAEKLHGRGDMLFIDAASQYPVRLQTPFLSESRTLEFIDAMRKKYHSGTSCHLP